MKDLDGMVVGSPQDYDRFREDIAAQDGVVFTRAPGFRDAVISGGKDRGDPAIESVRDALGKYRPRRALFLSPYRGMAADMKRLAGNGVVVRIAGPLPLHYGDVDPSIIELHRSDPGFTAMLDTSRHADFGDPVYLRMICSSESGKWQKWWRIFQACRKAEVLLDSPLRRVYVAAAGNAPRQHVTITLKTLRHSTGHLLVAPNGSGMEDDVFFLGTGGTLSDDPLLNQPGIYGKTDYRMMPGSVRRRLADLWSDDAVISLTGDEQRFYQDLLRAIGNSAGTGSGVCLDYPPS